MRLDVGSGVALIQNGICQLVNLNKDGLSIKCFEEFDFPDEWSVDIYDNTGLNLEGVKVKKVWEKRLGEPDFLTQSPEVEVGGKFADLSSSQETQLYSYLLKLLEADKDK